jgi:uncharacterized protein (TIGR03790 family)
VRLKTIALAVAALVVAALPGRVFAQTADNVLVVINDASPASVQVGEYYAHKRAIAQDHVVRLKTVTTETIPRAQYASTIEQPISAWLQQHLLEDKILYIVLTKGMPLRVDGTTGTEGTTASVDSELTVLYRKMVGAPPVSLTGRIQNPYFLDQRPLADAKPFTRFNSDIYLVTRLDGYTVDDVLKLVDRGAAPSSDGKIVLDERAQIVDSGGDRWLQEASDRLRQSGAGDRVVLEMTRAVAQQDGPIIGYYSWGSNDSANHLRHFGLQFVPGAIGALFVSTDGRTFVEPPADWAPGGPPKGNLGTQSLTGDLIRDGITGVAGHVSEPFLDATIRPQILFPAYLAGFNLVESFYLAMPFLSWETIVVGDPLCTPFPRQTLSPDQLYKPVDAETGLPGLFSERVIEVLRTEGTNPEAVKLSLRAQVSINNGNEAEANALYERAFALEPRLTLVGLRLAGIRDAQGDHAGAIAIYRKALAAQPNTIVLMNNLAYDLAEYQHDTEDALPLAQRAYGSIRDPNIGDTLGWIHHLRGDDRMALPLAEEAVAAMPKSAEVQMHAAFVHFGVGDLVKAKAEIETAVTLDPKLADRDDVKALRAKLK